MSVFLYLPSTCGAGRACRVDLANIGALFGDDDEPATPARDGMSLRQALLAVLVVLFAVGETVLMARPDALAANFFRPTHSSGQATT